MANKQQKQHTPQHTIQFIPRVIPSRVKMLSPKHTLSHIHSYSLSLSLFVSTFSASVCLCVSVLDSSPFKLDPRTAHKDLSLSQDNEVVTVRSREHSCPDNLERFDYWCQVLAGEGLSGRCYWEMSGAGWGSTWPWPMGT